MGTFMYNMLPFNNSYDNYQSMYMSSVQPDAHIQVHTEVIFILVVVDQETETYISMFYVNNNSQ
jgi:hypothetical protein